MYETQQYLKFKIYYCIDKCLLDEKNKSEYSIASTLLTQNIFIFNKMYINCFICIITQLLLIFNEFNLDWFKNLKN